MTADQQTSARRAVRSGSSAPVIASSTTDWTASKLVANVLSSLPGEGPRYVARAPGRLDVIGGLGEYTGALVLRTPIADHVCAAARRRTDGLMWIRLVEPTGLDGAAPLTLPLSKLLGSNGSPVDAEQGSKALAGFEANGAQCVIGVLAELQRAEIALNLGGGLSLAIGSTFERGIRAGGDAACAGAVLVAVTAAMNIEVEALSAAAVCQRVENHWLHSPVGPADAVGALLGESHTVTQLRCDPCTLVGTTRLPDDVLLLGIDSGVTHPDAAKRYERVRTAAFMGRALIDRIIRHDGVQPLRWDGYLSRIGIPDYVGVFRDRLPTRLSGREFLDRFGETGDPLTRIDPGFVYKVRSRTEHHIYEHARAQTFAECLTRSIRNADDGALAEAGEPMYASHWSYGQRCGLGGVEPDLLVSLLRAHGTEAGIFGAKVTGRGCGGVIVVLMRPTDRAIAAVEASLAEYEKRSGRTARLLRGSMSGAMIAGARRM